MLADWRHEGVAKPLFRPACVPSPGGGQQIGVRSGSLTARSWRAGVRCWASGPWRQTPPVDRAESGCGAGGEAGLPRRPISRRLERLQPWWSASGGSRGARLFNVNRRPSCACLEPFAVSTPRVHASCRAGNRRHRPGHLPRHGGEPRCATGAIAPPVHNDPALTGLLEEGGRDAALEPTGDPAGAALPGGGGFRRTASGRSGNDVPSGGGRAQGLRPAPHGSFNPDERSPGGGGEGCLRPHLAALEDGKGEIPSAGEFVPWLALAAAPGLILLANDQSVGAATASQRLPGCFPPW